MTDTPSTAAGRVRHFLNTARPLFSGDILFSAPLGGERVELLVSDLEALITAASAKAEIEPYSFEPLTGDGWAINGPGEQERHLDWSMDGYGLAVALDRETAVLIVDALNGKAEIEQAAVEPWKKALLRYGSHIGDCPQKLGYACTCGFAAALLSSAATPEGGE
jgi:hypothetical protein